MTRWALRSLLGRMVVDGAFRNEAIVIGPESMLSARASSLERDFVAHVGAAARAALISDLLDEPPPPRPPGDAREISIPAGAVATNTELTIAPDSADASHEISVVGPPDPRRSFVSARAALRLNPALARRLADSRVAITPIPIPRPVDGDSPLAITPIPIPRVLAPGALRFALGSPPPLRVAIESAAGVLRGAATEVNAVAHGLGDLGRGLATIGEHLGQAATALTSITRHADDGDHGAAIEAVGRVLGPVLRNTAALADRVGGLTGIATLGNAGDALGIIAGDLSAFTAGVAGQLASLVSGEVARAGESLRGAALTTALASRLSGLIASVHGGIGLAVTGLTDAISAVLETLLSFMVGVFTTGADPDAGVTTVRPAAPTAFDPGGGVGFDPGGGLGFEPGGGIGFDPGGGPEFDPGGGGRSFDGGGGIDLVASGVGRVALALATLIGGQPGAHTSAGRIRSRDLARIRVRFASTPSTADLHRAATEVLASVTRRLEPGT